jgi:hypothetical protein
VTRICDKNNNNNYNNDTNSSSNDDNNTLIEFCSVQLAVSHAERCSSRGCDCITFFGARHDTDDSGECW